MPVIDAQGKVFGRFNLVDALLVALLVAVVPVVYAARVLFRDPAAHLNLISPTTMSQGSDKLVELTGTSFRPYMRVSFGTVQAPSFQFYGPTQAFVTVPAGLEPGTYDVVLFDHASEVARMPRALTVTGPVRPPNLRLRIRGAYVGLKQEDVALLKGSLVMSATEGVYAEIEALDAARPSIARVRVSESLTVPVPMDGLLEVPATILATCPTLVGPGGVLRCATAGVAFVRDMHLTFQGPAGLMLFRIDEIESAVAGALTPK